MLRFVWSRTEDRRVPKVLGAAQAAAMVDDRRLLRVLDILDIKNTLGTSRLHGNY